MMDRLAFCLFVHAQMNEYTHTQTDLHKTKQVLFLEKFIYSLVD